MLQRPHHRDGSCTVHGELISSPATGEWLDDLRDDDLKRSGVEASEGEDELIPSPLTRIFKSNPRLCIFRFGGNDVPIDTARPRNGIEL